MPPSLFGSGNHHCQWLGHALLSLPQCPDRFVIRGIAGQQESPQTLHGHNPTLFEGLGGGSQGIRLNQGIAPAIEQLNPGTASGTGIGLSMEASVQGIIILRLALRAHLEVAHGCPGAVIGHVFNDRKSGAAVRAVDERVAVAPIRGIQ